MATQSNSQKKPFPSASERTIQVGSLTKPLSAQTRTGASKEPARILPMKTEGGQVRPFPINYQPIATESSTRALRNPLYALPAEGFKHWSQALCRAKQGLQEKVVFLAPQALGSKTKFCLSILGLVALVSAGMLTGVYTHQLLASTDDASYRLAEADTTYAKPIQSRLDVHGNDLPPASEQTAAAIDAEETAEETEGALSPEQQNKAFVAVLHQSVEPAQDADYTLKTAGPKEVSQAFEACKTKPVEKPAPAVKPKRRIRLTSRGFARPVLAGSISSPYGYRHGRMHHGIDYAARIGTPIRAAAAGKVIYSGWQSGYGRLIEVRHPNGYKTKYAHCSRLYVRKGQSVVQGQRIASVGNSGRSTGPHLHFELIAHGSSVNPYRYVETNVRVASVRSQHPSS